jgi:hypothetical protein
MLHALLLPRTHLLSERMTERAELLTGSLVIGLPTTELALEKLLHVLGIASGHVHFLP